jgi:dynactin 5
MENDVAYGNDISHLLALMSNENRSTSSSHPSTDATSDQGYIVTLSGNYISRNNTVLHEPKNIELKGRSFVEDHVELFGNCAPIRMGRYCRIGSNTTISPPIVPIVQNTVSSISNPPNITYIPVVIGSHTLIGLDCHISAAAIGSACFIGNSVRIHDRVIIKDCCIIADNTIIPSDTVIPPFTHVSASSSAISTMLSFRELSPSTLHEMQERCIEVYQELVTIANVKK